MLRRARGQLKGPLAIAGLVVLAACSRPAEDGPAAGPIATTTAAIAEPASPDSRATRAAVGSPGRLPWAPTMIASRPDCSIASPSHQISFQQMWLQVSPCRT